MDEKVLKKISKIDSLNESWSSLPVLFSFLGDSEWQVRKAAINSLSRYKNVEVGNYLVKMLDDSRVSVRNAAQKALISLGEVALKAVMDNYDSLGRRGKNLAAQVLGEIGNKEISPFILSVIAEEEDPTVRGALLETAAKLGVYSIRNELKKDIHSSNSWLAQVAIISAGEMKDIYCLPDISKKLHFEDFREAAIEAIGKMGNVRGIRELLPFIKTKHQEVTLKAINEIIASEETEMKTRAEKEILKEEVEEIFNQKLLTQEDVMRLFEKGKGENLYNILAFYPVPLVFHYLRVEAKQNPLALPAFLTSFDGLSKLEQDLFFKSFADAPLDEKLALAPVILKAKKVEQILPFLADEVYEIKGKALKRLIELKKEVALPFLFENLPNPRFFEKAKDLISSNFSWEEVKGKWEETFALKPFSRPYLIKLAATYANSETLNYLLQSLQSDVEAEVKASLGVLTHFPLKSERVESLIHSLYSSFSDGNKLLALEALSAVGSLRSQRFLESLIKKNSSEAPQAALTLLKLGGTFPVEKAIKFLESSSDKILALEILKLAGSEANLSLVLPFISNRDPKIRKVVVEVIGEWQKERAFPIFVDHLDKEKDLEVRKAIYHHLLNSGGEREFGLFLKKVLEDNDEAAVSAISEVNRRELLPLILPLMEKEEMRQKVLNEEFPLLSKESYFLLPLLSHHSPFVRRDVAYLAGKIKEVKVLPYFSNLLNDPDVRVRQAAAASLSELQSSEILELLVLKSVHEQDWVVRRLVQKAIKEVV